jgi:hypothetical protein
MTVGGHIEVAVDALFLEAVDQMIQRVHALFVQLAGGGKAPTLAVGENVRCVPLGIELVETDEAKAAIVYDAISRKVSDYCLQQCYRVFLTSVPDKDNINLQYLRLAFKLGPGVDSLHSHPAAQSGSAPLRFIHAVLLQNNRYHRSPQLKLMKNTIILSKLYHLISFSFIR